MLLIKLIPILLVPSAAAQFQFFDNMFGHQQQQQNAPTRGGDWYRDQVLDTQCGQGKYLCPETLDCVAKPLDCPCAFDLVKCHLGQHRVCVSKNENVAGCERTESYRKGISL